MQQDNKDRDRYEDTVDRSKEVSLQKATAIFLEELEANKPKVQRPDIHPHRGVIKIAIVLFLFLLLCFTLRAVNISPWYGVPLLLIVVLLSAKRTVLWMILLYQKYAPEHVRTSCVFTPTCSEYMMQAIGKYGLLKGGAKGIKRLLRCHPPNGGDDLP